MKWLTNGKVLGLILQFFLMVDIKIYRFTFKNQIYIQYQRNLIKSNSEISIFWHFLSYKCIFLCPRGRSYGAQILFVCHCQLETIVLSMSRICRCNFATLQLLQSKKRERGSDFSNKFIYCRLKNYSLKLSAYLASLLRL